MQNLRIERADLRSKRQRRDLTNLMVLGVVAIGMAFYFVPPGSLFTEWRPKGVDYDWTVHVGAFDFGLLALNGHTLVACVVGYVQLPIPWFVFLACTLLLVFSPVLWLVRRCLRHENAT